MAEDLQHASDLLDKFPNADVEISARFQDLGRQPYSARKWLIKYQDRALFGSDGSPDRQVEQFWSGRHDAAMVLQCEDHSLAPGVLAARTDYLDAPLVSLHLGAGRAFLYLPAVPARGRIRMFRKETSW